MTDHAGYRRVLVVLVLIAAVAGLAPRGSHGARGQESQTGQEDDPLAGSESVMSAALSDEEQAALELVEEILAEQDIILRGQNFVYRAEARRDPFRNLLRLRRRELTAPTERPPGLAGFLTSEVELKGTALFQGRWHAMLAGLDQQIYFAEVGTELYDGRVVSIRENEVVFEQEVEDMLGARSTRQVVKSLTEEDEGP